MKKSALAVLFLPLIASAQTVVEKSVNIIYGNQVIHARHQVVLASPDDVTVIPAKKNKLTMERPNVVVSPDGSSRSYLEENAIAAKEKAIYDEVNRRTEEAPFTVLFTGHVPDTIQEKRLRMMPEVGIFGDQLSKLNKSEQQTVEDNEVSQGIKPDLGDFSAISPNGSVQPDVKIDTSEAKGQALKDDGASPSKMTQEAKLEKLIGG